LNSEDRRKNIAPVDPDFPEVPEDYHEVKYVDPKEKFYVETSIKQRIFEVVRFTYSGLLNLAAILIVFPSLVSGDSAFTTDFGANGIGGAILLILLIFYLGFLEGGQAAIYSLSNKSPRSYENKYKRAAALHASIKDTEALERYVIGRQLMTLFTNFVTANLTAFPLLSHYPGIDSFQFGSVFRFFLSTGLVGAFFSLNFGAVTPEIVAAKYPVQYFNTPLLKITVWTSWFFEFLGIANASFIYAKIVGLPFDYSVTEKVRVEAPLDDSFGTTGTTDWWEKMPTYQDNNDLNEIDYAYRAVQKGLVVPNFLLPPDHPNYQVPYRAALKLLQEIRDEPTRQAAAQVVFPHAKPTKPTDSKRHEVDLDE